MEHRETLHVLRSDFDEFHVSSLVIQRPDFSFLESREFFLSDEATCQANLTGATWRALKSCEFNELLNQKTDVCSWDQKTRTCHR